MTDQEFAYLSDRIRGKLVKLARRFNRATGLDMEADDIVQDALVTLWQLAEKGYPIRDAEALAVKITKTRCVERYLRSPLISTSHIMNISYQTIKAGRVHKTPPALLLFEMLLYLSFSYSSRKEAQDP